MTDHPFKAGQRRDQVALLPPRVEDYVGRDNMVRAIDAYVRSLDLATLGFRHARHEAGAGQPPYHPADLLALYLYGYINQVRSSRRLERELRRNVELIWLLRGLTPGYRTIADFRRANVDALRAVNRDFVVLLRALDLVAGEKIAIDGAYFHGDASKASIITRKRLEKRLAAVDQDIAAYNAAVDANDAAEGRQPRPADAAGGDLADKLQALLDKRAAVQEGLAKLEASGETQLSRTDEDARLLAKNGQTVAGFNVQIAVDDKNKLIVASAVVNDGNDTGQLHDVALAAKQALEVTTLTAVADAGYFNGDTLRACEESGIVAYVPEPNRGTALLPDGRFGAASFTYDAAADAYRCPNQQMLRPAVKRRQYKTGKSRIRYVSSRRDCRLCPLRTKCLSASATRREIERWEHEEVIDRHRLRMAQPQAEAMMKARKALAEHPFGTLKCRAGYRHFLLRGFKKVRGEWALMMLCYNFTRVLNIIGWERFLAYLTAYFQPAAHLLALVVAHAMTRARNQVIWQAGTDGSCGASPPSVRHLWANGPPANEFLPSLAAQPTNG